MKNISLERLVLIVLLGAYSHSTVAEKVELGSYHVRNISEDQFAANLYLPRNQTNLSVVIIIGGSSGGMRTERGELLASQGIAALTLAYFRHKDLPNTLDNIPVESVLDAIDYLQTTEKIDASRIGIWGASRGSELAFLAATNDPRIVSLVATVPSLVAWHGATSSYAWTFKGQPVHGLSFDRRSKKPIYERASHALTDKDQVAKAQFNFNKINGPMLLVSAEQDKVWPSYAMANTIKSQLHDQAHKHPVVHRSFPTGHSFSAELMPEINQLIINHFNKSLNHTE